MRGIGPPLLGIRVAELRELTAADEVPCGFGRQVGQALDRARLGDEPGMARDRYAAIPDTPPNRPS